MTLPDSDWRALYSALVCGTSLPAGEELQLFVDTGLIHLMVVSGSHLVFVEQIFFFLNRRAILTVLGLYCFLTGFQPPVVRAFLRRFLGPFATERWGMTALQIEALTVLAVLCLLPHWIFSRSFLMSWMCGLAMVAPKWLPRFPTLDLSIKCYFFILPFCLATPVTVFWNALVAPWVGVILFPACLASIVIPPLHIVADLIWTTFIFCLKNGPQGQPSQVFIDTNWLWLWPTAVHLLLIIWEIKWRRHFAFL